MKSGNIVFYKSVFSRDYDCYVIYLRTEDKTKKWCRFWEMDYLEHKNLYTEEGTLTVIK